MKKQKFLVSFEYEFDNSHNINAELLTNKQAKEIISSFLKSKSSNIKNIDLVEKTKMEHEILEEHLKSKYSEEQLKENVNRAINRELPENPDKSMR